MGNRVNNIVINVYGVIRVPDLSSDHSISYINVELLCRTPETSYYCISTVTEKLKKKVLMFHFIVTQ